MSGHYRRAFTLIPVIIALFLAGIVLLVGGRDAQQWQAQADHLEAEQTCRCLTRSARAWILHQATRRPGVERPCRSLDTATLSGRPAAVTITASEVDPNTLWIEARARHGRQTATRRVSVSVPRSGRATGTKKNTSRALAKIIPRR